MSVSLVETPLQPGFASPALDAQIAFRALMEAWARPGTVAHLPRPAAPEGLAAAAATVALTLCDADTRVWLSRSAATASNWLRFHCGCPIVDEESRDTAAFLYCSSDEVPDLSSVNTGTAIAPEGGATLVISVPEEKSTGSALVLSGPGVPDQRRLTGYEIPAALIEQRASYARRYPAGVDLILVRNDESVCIPRTSHIQQEIS